MKTTNNRKQPQRCIGNYQPLTQLLMQIAANLAWNAC
jgi:hypothetical protein